jgi:hypothetical protein
MKYFILLLSLFITLSITNEAYSATCSSTSRTNYSTGQTLTSSALNADFNQLVSKVNSLDGGCVTDGTLEASALSAADFATVTNGIHQGCALAYVDGNTVQVGKCILSVNGSFVKTTTTNNVTWGCSGCSSEVVSTAYYVYAKSGSSGTTLNLLISTTAPGVDGYDGSSNKVIGKFFNNASSAIASTSLFSWNGNGYHQPQRVSFSFTYSDGAATPCSGACSTVTQGGDNLVTSVTESSGNYTVVLRSALTSIFCNGNADNAKMVNEFELPTSTTLTFNVFNYTGSAAQSYGTINCQGY